MRNWKSWMVVAATASLTVAALGSEVVADSPTKPKTGQAADAEKKMMPPTAATPKESGMGAETPQQGEEAGAEGSHEEHEGSHSEGEEDEGAN